MTEFKCETQGAATFLIYQKKEQDIIDSMSMGMISNNRIDGILPFVYVQMDDAVYFKYNISAKNTLQQYFSGVVNKKRFLGVLGSLVNTFILSEEYMLETSSFVLDPSFIYINPVTSEASIVVLPIVRNVEITIEDFIKSFVFGIQFDQTEDCSYIAALISFLNSNQFFSVRDFKKLIEELQQEKKENVVFTSVQPQTSMFQEQSHQQKVIETYVSNTPASFSPVEKMEPEIKEADSQMWNPIPEDKPEKKGFFARRQEKKEEKKKEKKQKKSFFGKKEKASSKEKNFKGMAIPGMEMPEKEDKLSGISEIQLQQTKASEELQSVVPVQKHTVEKQDFGETVDLRAYLEGTTVLTGTTVLANTPSRTSPFLLNLRTREKFVIVKGTSKIGKDPVVNDFCIHGNSAISREHAIIYLQNGQVFIMDNHSTNGTYVNGVRLQPGIVSVALNEGTKLQLGDEELEFRIHE